MKVPRSNELRFPAVAVSRGIGIGRVVFPDDQLTSISAGAVLDAVQTDNELERFRTAVEQAAKDLADLSAADPNGIFGVQQLILEDSFVDDVIACIRRENTSAEIALRKVSAEFVKKQRSVADSYISEKYIDIQDVTDRLLKALAPKADSDEIPKGMIYVVDDLTPSKVMELARSHPKAIISAQGGWTSHAAILGRELQLPIVSGFRSPQDALANGDVVIVDALEGQIVVAPSRDTLRAYRTKKRVYVKETAYEVISARSHATLDGREIVIRVNANTRESYERAKRSGASGIGLFRSESLIRDEIPIEEEQFAAYSEIGEIVGDEGVRIRTFDIARDSIDSAFKPKRNPALGLRAIRLSLTLDSIFSTQVRAILRSAARYKLDIVLPMVSSVDDVVRAKGLIERQRHQLISDGVQPGSPQVGAMIEVPSAVMTASSIARHVDFLCLGTNDLVQYLLAVDRDDPSVADWYQTLHPAVLGSIRAVIAAGSALGKPVEICGEMAGSAFYVPLLIGLGATELSMNSASVDAVRRVISGLDSTLCVELAHLTVKCETAEEVSAVLASVYKKHWAELFPHDQIALNSSRMQ